MGKKLYPDKQHIIELVDGLYQLGLRSVVVCPGSRSAPLTLAFARHGGFQICTVIDERSAAYVALGQALSAHGTTAVALVCTSGTALLNMGPAVAESYYLRLPLLIMSADRPAMSIDQLDGQTIRQGNVFEAHTVFSGTLPEHGRTNIDLKRSRKMMHEAWTCMMGQQGPAHLNVPLHEPLYDLPAYAPRLIQHQPNSDSNAPVRTGEISEKTFSGAAANNQQLPMLLTQFGEEEMSLLSKLKETLRHAGKILLVPGQSAPDVRLDELVEKWTEDPRVVVLMEPVGNVLNGIKSSNLKRGNAGEIQGLVIRHEDVLTQDSIEVHELRPDVIISWGLQIVGKRTRNWLRRIAETELFSTGGTFRPLHFRLDPVGWSADPYHNPPVVIRISPAIALHAVSEAIGSKAVVRDGVVVGIVSHNKDDAESGEVLNQNINIKKEQIEHQQYDKNSTGGGGHAANSTIRTYQADWRDKERKAEDTLVPLLKYLPFGDLSAIQEVSRHISHEHAVHLGNSMPIRYWQMLGGGIQKWWLHANRGTSGIDGVNSTALGFALSNPGRVVWLITGELSFVYDLNAFSCSERPDNLRIVVINNQGGDIFRLIDGPSRQPECEALFATPRNLNLQALASGWGCDTIRATNAFQLNEALGKLHTRPTGRGPVVLEVLTEPKANQIVYQSYQKALLNLL